MKRQRSRRAIGNAWEDIACAALEQAGLKTLERNFHVRGGEIDLVMRENDTIVFVEVRQRSYATHGRAIETITGAKCSRIRRAASIWLSAQKKSDWPCRFDVYCIDGDAENAETEWIRGAF